MSLHPYDHFAPIHDNPHENLAVSAARRMAGPRPSPEPRILFADTAREEPLLVLSIQEADDLVEDYARWRARRAEAG